MTAKSLGGTHWVMEVHADVPSRGWAPRCLTCAWPLTPCCWRRGDSSLPHALCSLENSSSASPVSASSRCSSQRLCPLLVPECCSCLLCLHIPPSFLPFHRIKIESGCKRNSTEIKVKAATCTALSQAASEPVNVFPVFVAPVSRNRQSAFVYWQHGFLHKRRTGCAGLIDTGTPGWKWNWETVSTSAGILVYLIWCAITC